MILGISQRTLEKDFAKNIGRSPHQWLTDQRMIYARALLLEYRVVKVAALLVHYRDTPQFTKAFKKAHGIAPSEYVKRFAPGE